MFNAKHYVPILKWKRAEQGALESLPEERKKFVTPLIQLVMPKQKLSEQLESLVARFEGQLNEIPYKIIEVWGNTPIFIDVSLLFTVPLRAKCLESLVTQAYKLGAVFIPVVHLSDDQIVKKAACLGAKEAKQGLCLRLTCSDLEDINILNQNISTFLLDSGLNEKDIDLLIDIKDTEDDENKYSNYFSIGQSIKNLTLWRTFIFSSGSFPEDLSQCRLDEENLLPRVDWICWKNINEVDPTLIRKPAFSDYTIQFPIYKELSQFFHPTSSIKYTLDNEWLVMKGKKQKFELYLASAAELVKDKRFYGENFSEGDKYIAEKARHFETYIKNPVVKGTGSTETWLKAGINHHLALVSYQIANQT